MFKLSITKEEFNRLKNLRFKKNDFKTKCLIKMFEPFFRKSEDKLIFSSENSNGYENFNILFEVPNFIGDVVKIKTDSEGNYEYMNEDFIGKIKMPLKNWTFTLKNISETTTFCYFLNNEYIVMKKDFASIPVSV